SNRCCARARAIQPNWLTANSSRPGSGPIRSCSWIGSKCQVSTGKFQARQGGRLFHSREACLINTALQPGGKRSLRLSELFQQRGSSSTCEIEFSCNDCFDGSTHNRLIMRHSNFQPGRDSSYGAVTPGCTIRSRDDPSRSPSGD